MKIEIQVQDGKVTITVGGSPPPPADNGTITSQGSLRSRADAEGSQGSGALDDTNSGSGGPGGGTLVIGPIVVDCSCLQGADSGAAATDIGTAGAGALDDTVSGSGGPSTGVVVIGPIVVGGQGRGPGNADSPPTLIAATPTVRRVSE